MLIQEKVTTIYEYTEEDFKTIIETKMTTTYICKKCDSRYEKKENAFRCEQKPITQDKGVKVGDTVKVTYGDGKGDLARVTKVYICNDKEGHYAWEKYWHTVALVAEFLDGIGTRVLHYDWYEVV